MISAENAKAIDKRINDALSELNRALAGAHQVGIALDIKPMRMGGAPWVEVNTSILISNLGEPT